MEAFKVHELTIAGRHYILLPKLNALQMDTLARRLTHIGLIVRRSNVISAKSAKGTIHVDPRGLCWSVFDPSDEVLPAIPGLLETKKERKSLRELMGHYFTLQKSGAKTVVKLSLRVESSTLWKALRASNGCGLTPDEHAVASLLLKKSKGDCRMLTDYPTEGSTMRIYGRKRYYDSRVGSLEAHSTLRQVGLRSPRNSFVPGDGAMTFDQLFLPSMRELGQFFESLGEWCFFRPA